ncbi:MAG: hypothetical protein RL204_401 [Bacteroidota bacterium]|jgi:hypothetical protein
MKGNTILKISTLLFFSFMIGGFIAYKSGAFQTEPVPQNVITPIEVSPPSTSTPAEIPHKEALEKKQTSNFPPPPPDRTPGQKIIINKNAKNNSPSEDVRSNPKMFSTSKSLLIVEPELTFSKEDSVKYNRK